MSELLEVLGDSHRVEAVSCEWCGGALSDRVEHVKPSRPDGMRTDRDDRRCSLVAISPFTGKPYVGARTRQRRERRT